MNTDVISTLEDLIRIDSRNPFEIVHEIIDGIDNWKIGGNEIDIAEYIEKDLLDAGFSVEHQHVHIGLDGRHFYNLLAEKGEGKKSILFYAHMDTVTSKPWLSVEEALTPKRGYKKIRNKKKEILIGLGSNDMKAGIAALIHAFKDVEPKGYRLKLAFGVDEEFYSFGANKLAQSDFIKDVKAVIVPEIGDGPNPCYGPSTIGIGRLGRCEFIIKVYGTGGHGADANNHEYVNALEEAAKIVSELDNIKDSLDDYYKFFDDKSENSNKNVTKGSFYPSKLDVGEGNLTIPIYGELTIDWTFTPHLKIKNIHNILNNMISKMYATKRLKKAKISGKFQKIKVETKLRPTSFSNGYITPADSPFVRFTKKILENSIGFKNYNMGYSVADENVFRKYNKNLPVLVIGPFGENSHRSGEWVDIDNVYDLVKAYKEIALNFGDYSKSKNR